MTLYFWALFVISCLLLFPVALLVWLVTCLFDRRRLANHYFTCIWSSLYTWLNPAWPTRIVGGDRIPKDSACVFVPNHQSIIDIFVLFRLFVPFKWISKIENFWVPIVGWNMWFCRYISIKRGKLRGNIDMLRACKNALAAGDSLVIFPEGRRTTDGRLQRFKNGAFDLAKRSGVPLVPLVIDGSYRALPPKSLLLRGRRHITVTVLEPISADVVKASTPADLLEETRKRIIEALPEEARPVKQEEEKTVETGTSQT